MFRSGKAQDGDFQLTYATAYWWELEEVSIKINIKRKAITELLLRKLVVKYEDKFSVEGESDVVIIQYSGTLYCAIL